jgi:hypothetical protein
MPLALLGEEEIHPWPLLSGAVVAQTEFPHAQHHRRVTRECLTIRIGRKLRAVDVIDTLSDLFILRGVPGHIRSDNGPESVAKACANGLPLSAPRPPASEPIHLDGTDLRLRPLIERRAALAAIIEPGCSGAIQPARSAEMGSTSTGEQPEPLVALER